MTRPDDLHERGFGAASARARGAAMALVCLATTAVPSRSYADEGGVSFWVPGIYGTLDATPKTPGFSFAGIGYVTDVTGFGAIAAQRAVEIGRFNPTIGLNLDIKLRATAALVFLDPAYTFADPILGGQLTLDVAGVAGYNSATLSGMLSATVGPATFTRQATVSDSVSGIGDLYPKLTMRWTTGVDNYMAYLTGDVPVGAYSATRLANLGIGHGAIDGGAGYTYFNPETGQELSFVTGLTYNFVNTHTQYQNGIDWHLDWGVAQFVDKTNFFGINGYFYEQLNADRGSAPVLGPIRSGVIGIGPQAGTIIPLGSEQGFLSLKVYREFANHDRPDGWNGWVTFSISAAPPPAAKTAANPVTARF